MANIRTLVIFVDIKSIPDHMLNPQIELERSLNTQIHEALHGDIVETIIRQSSIDQGGDY